MDDLRIIELFFERDEQAIKETDAKYGKLCHSIAYNILNIHEDSEECVNVSLDELAAVLPDERYAPEVSVEDVGKLISKFLRTQKGDVRNVFIHKYYFLDSIGEIAQFLL